MWLTRGCAGAHATTTTSWLTRALRLPNFDLTPLQLSAAVDWSDAAIASANDISSQLQTLIGVIGAGYRGSCDDRTSCAYSQLSTVSRISYSSIEAVIVPVPFASVDHRCHGRYN